MWCTIARGRNIGQHHHPEFGAFLVDGSAALHRRVVINRDIELYAPLNRWMSILLLPTGSMTDEIEKVAKVTNPVNLAP